MADESGMCEYEKEVMKHRAMVKASIAALEADMKDAVTEL